MTALAAVPPALLAVVVWRARDEPGALPYAAMLGVMVAYILLYALTLITHVRPLHEFLFSTAALLKLLVTVPWIVFALEYTGRGRLVTRTVLGALLAPPLLGVLVTITPYRAGLMVQHYALDVRHGVVVSAFERGPLWLLLAFLGFIYLGVGIAVLLEFVVTDREQYGVQTAVLAVAGVIPGVATIGNIVGAGPFPALDLTPFAYAAAAVIVWYGHVRWDLFGFSPATRRIGQAAAIDDLGDAVFIVDEDHHVVDVNSRAEDVLGRPTGDLLHTPIGDVLGTDLDAAATGQTVRIETPRGWCEFSCAVSSIDGSRGGTIGYTIVLHEITTETQRRQRYEVLNRILRHNLRNTMNAIVGYSNQLGDQVNGSHTWMVDRIEQQSTQLVTISEKARDIDRVTTPSRDPAEFGLATALQRVRQRLTSDYPDVTVTVDTPEGLTVRTNEVVFEELVEYAAESVVRYNDADDPTVTLRAAPTTADRPWIDCTITSNGDPIPEEERVVIERGEETPLDHSHDLDLWLVSWGVDTLGGELEFLVDDDLPGIMLSIPDLQPVEQQDLARRDTPTS